ncbi:hypothetical protein LCGC14_2147010, partial [marine sediment metagenome]
VDGLCRAILKFEQARFEEGVARENARRFAPERFLESFGAFVDKLAGIEGPA